ncbi:MAG TPA: hypothetical protein VE548_09875, partial [Nitrososphaeraceae archaeon]|nr:hypothetical protein [Nitrososphaeraceae archaeon]
MKDIGNNRWGHSFVTVNKFILIAITIISMPLCTVALTSSVHAQVQQEQQQQSSSAPSSQQ